MQVAPPQALRRKLCGNPNRVAGGSEAAGLVRDLEPDHTGFLQRQILNRDYRPYAGRRSQRLAVLGHPDPQRGFRRLGRIAPHVLESRVNGKRLARLDVARGNRRQANRRTCRHRKRQEPVQVPELLRALAINRDLELEGLHHRHRRADARAAPGRIAERPLDPVPRPQPAVVGVNGHCRHERPPVPALIEPGHRPDAALRYGADRHIPRRRRILELRSPQPRLRSPRHTYRAAVIHSNRTRRVDDPKRHRLPGHGRLVNLQPGRPKNPVRNPISHGVQHLWWWRQRILPFCSRRHGRRMLLRH